MDLQKEPAPGPAHDTAVLLCNLGTPDAPTASALGIVDGAVAAVRLLSGTTLKTT